MNEVVVDTSAAVALLTGEALGGGVAHVIGRADHRLMSAASLVELGIVMEARFGPVGGAVVERFLRAAAIEIADLDGKQAHAAIDAWRRFGKGRHRANLNYGDCFTYALASTSGASIVCTGDDFPATDVSVVPTS